MEDFQKNNNRIQQILVTRNVGTNWSRDQLSKVNISRSMMLLPLKVHDIHDQLDPLSMNNSRNYE